MNDGMLKTVRKDTIRNKKIFKNLNDCAHSVNKVFKMKTFY